MRARVKTCGEVAAEASAGTAREAQATSWGDSWRRRGPLRKKGPWKTHATGQREAKCLIQAPEGALKRGLNVGAGAAGVARREAVGPGGGRAGGDERRAEIGHAARRRAEHEAVVVVDKKDLDLGLLSRRRLAALEIGMTLTVVRAFMSSTETVPAATLAV